MWNSAPELLTKRGEYTCAVAPVFAVKYYCSVFLQKNASLGEFYRHPVVDWVCYRIVTVKGIAHGED